MSVVNVYIFCLMPFAAWSILEVRRQHPLVAMAAAGEEVLAAETFFRRREYDRKREAAGIMPCLHMSVVCGKGSSAASSSMSRQSKKWASFQHHMIFDRDRDEYIHVMEDENQHGRWKVARTGRRTFEDDFAARPQVVNTPSTQMEAAEILDRARVQVGEDWKYHYRTNNCEHFVTQCWDEVARSQQAEQVDAIFGATRFIGMVGSSTAIGVMTAATTSGAYLLLIPARLVAPIMGIAAGAVVVGGSLVAGVAYGAREWNLHDRAANAKLLPITVSNESAHPVTVSLRNDHENLNFPIVWDALHASRGVFGVGINSRLVDPKMAEELNPSTLSDNGEMFVLTITNETETDTINISRRVSRGDVIKFDADRRVQMQQIQPEECGICLQNPPNVLLQPCGHWQYCEQCIQQVMHHTATCPLCRQHIKDFYVDRRGEQ